MAYVLGILFIAIGRYSIRRIQGHLLRKGFGAHRTILVGNGRYAKQLARIFNDRPQLGFKVIRTVANVDVKSLDRINAKKGIDEMIQTDPTMPEEDYKSAKGNYIIDSENLQLIKPSSRILHPLPHVEELNIPIETEKTDPRVAYFRQVENGLYIRMALLSFMLENSIQ